MVMRPACQCDGANSIGQIMLTQQWYLENFPRLKAAFEDGTLAGIPLDRDILDDLRAVSIIKGIPRIPDGKTKTGAGQQRPYRGVAQPTWRAGAGRPTD